MTALEFIVPGLLHSAVLLPLHPDHHVGLLVCVAGDDHVHGREGDNRGRRHLIHSLGQEAVVEVKHLRLAVVLFRSGPAHGKEGITCHLSRRFPPHDLEIPLLLPTVAKRVQKQPIQSPSVIPPPANQGGRPLPDQRATAVNVDATARPTDRVVVVRVQKHGGVHGPQRHQLLHEKPLQVLQGLMHTRAVNVVHVGDLGRLALRQQVALHRLGEMVHTGKAATRGIQRARGHRIDLGLGAGRVRIALRSGGSDEGVIHKAPHSVGTAHLAAGAFSLESGESPGRRSPSTTVSISTGHQLLR
mmetsp:Transcript_31596/g.69204  ORF Transcript_31596/g.69204 Transcript_31596/m.69204 type:complete len:301 (-) Transcript_31596:301-1203(-)